MRPSCRPSRRKTPRTGSYLSLLIMLVCLTGCTFQQAAKPPVFYPPQSKDPRIQYLTSFTVIGDIVPPALPFLPKDLHDDPLFLKPYGIAVKGSRIYACDSTAGRITVLDVEKGTVDNFGQDTLQTPINVTLDNDGNIFVADTGKKTVTGTL